MRFSVTNFLNKKIKGEKLTMITAYDFLSARIAEKAGVDCILVGDSLGMVMLGYEDTLKVTMEDMISHAAAVSRGCQSPMIVVDMPFMSYQASVDEAVKNAGELIKKGSGTAVKLEGGVEYAQVIKAVVRAGIPVMGHIGFTPQSVNTIGGHKSQGKTLATARKVLEDALAVQEAGAFAVVLECVPFEIAKYVTERLDIPTIGIGSGVDCDGQVLVIHDLLGMNGGRVFKHAKLYANIEADMEAATKKYVEEVHNKVFPTEQNSFVCEKGVIEALKGEENGNI